MKILPLILLSIFFYRIDTNSMGYCRVEIKKQGTSQAQTVENLCPWLPGETMKNKLEDRLGEPVTTLTPVKDLDDV